MSDSSNTFMSMKPEMKEVYSDKKSRFKKLKSKMPKKGCGCKPEPKDKCSCKKP